MMSTAERSTELPRSIPIEPSREYGESEPNEFDYRPVPVLAPVSLCLGLVAAVGMLGLLGLAIPLLGTILGGVCLRQILRSNGEYGGFVPAVVGFGLSAVFLLFGTVFHAHAFATEVPEGYERVNFTQDISKKEFVVAQGQLAPHPDVAALDGRKIFLKGYMFPQFTTEKLKGFVFVRDSGDCCFGGNPPLTDMINVAMTNSKTADYSSGLVSVAGTFHVNDPRTGAEMTPVYELEADHVERSRTPFR
ncbi:MAG: DUF4190 domain-containing protein [Planctomycetaceae bacterium]